MILFQAGHPAHLHIFNRLSLELKKKGIENQILLQDKESTIELAKNFGLNYHYIGEKNKGILGKFIGGISKIRKIYEYFLQTDAKLIIGILDVYGAVAAKLLGKTSISLTDTEHARLATILTVLFSDFVITPNCFLRDLGPKQIKYDGYHELVYLHPNYFTPDPSSLKYLNISEGTEFILIRFVSWEAAHDIGYSGLNLSMKKKLVKDLSEHCKVFISSEADLPNDLEKYKIEIPASEMHNILYFSSLYIGEGATMASECSILGTPSIYVNPLKLGYIKEQEEKYKLVHSLSDFNDIKKKAIKLLESQKKLKSVNREIINDKQNVTSFLVNFLKDYASA